MRRSMCIVFLVGMRRILSRKCKNLTSEIGKELKLKSSKNSYTIFKQTNLLSSKNSTGVLFEIEFKFKEGIPKIFSPTIPFFVGMPGFKSKFWLVDKDTGAYAGQYIFETKEDAVGYGNSAAQKLVKSLCIPGFYTWIVIDN